MNSHRPSLPSRSWHPGAFLFAALAACNPEPPRPSGRDLDIAVVHVEHERDRIALGIVQAVLTREPANARAKAMQRQIQQHLDPQRLRALAEAGEPQAMSRLGRMLMYGTGVDADPPAAIEWYRRAAAQGRGIAMGRLGFAFANGKGVQRDDAEAVAWYRKGIAAGEPTSMANLAFLIDQGRADAGGPVESLALTQRAALGGSPIGLHNMASRHDEGRGVSQDASLAFRLYLAAAALGLERSWMVVLTELQRPGRQQLADTVLADLREAAARGEPPAQRVLGACLCAGVGQAPDVATGMRWIERAAAAEDLVAMTQLAQALQHGHEVEQDAQRAFALLLAAARKDHVPAWHLVAVVLLTGNGTETDVPGALVWLRKGEQLGDGGCLRNLARCHAEGIGVPKDPVAARACLRRAEQAGGSDVAAAPGGGR